MASASRRYLVNWYDQLGQQQSTGAADSVRPAGLAGAAGATGPSDAAIAGRGVTPVAIGAAGSADFAGVAGAGGSGGCKEQQRAGSYLE